MALPVRNLIWPVGDGLSRGRRFAPAPGHQPLGEGVQVPQARERAHYSHGEVRAPCPRPGSLSGQSGRITWTAWPAAWRASATCAARKAPTAGSGGKWYAIRMISLGSNSSKVHAATGAHSDLPGLAYVIWIVAGQHSEESADQGLLRECNNTENAVTGSGQSEVGNMLHSN